MTTPRTGHINTRTSHQVGDTWHAAACTWHVTTRDKRVTRDKWHVTTRDYHRTLHTQTRSSFSSTLFLLCIVKVFWSFDRIWRHNGPKTPQQLYTILLLKNVRYKQEGFHWEPGILRVSLFCLPDVTLSAACTVREAWAEGGWSFKLFSYKFQSCWCWPKIRERRHKSVDLKLELSRVNFWL